MLINTSGFRTYKVSGRQRTPWVPRVITDGALGRNHITFGRETGFDSHERIMRRRFARVQNEWRANRSWWYY